MRPRRRRELGLQALDVLWRLHAPPPGSRLQAFRVAFRKVQAAATDIGISADVFEQWADALRFVSTTATMTCRGDSAADRQRRRASGNIVRGFATGRGADRLDPQPLRSH